MTAGALVGGRNERWSAAAGRARIRARSRREREGEEEEEEALVLTPCDVTESEYIAVIVGGWGGSREVGGAGYGQPRNIRKAYHRGRSTG